jgi:hypothetical protein
VGAMERGGCEYRPRDPSDGPEQVRLECVRHAVLGGALQTGVAADRSRHGGRGKCLRCLTMEAAICNGMSHMRHADVNRWGRAGGRSRKGCAGSVYNGMSHMGHPDVNRGVGVAVGMDGCHLQWDVAGATCGCKSMG